MNIVHSLTAYRLSFAYLLRNNPQKELLSEVIKSEEHPKLSVSEFLNLLISTGNNDGYITIDDFAFKLKSIDNYEEFDEYRRYKIVPKAGKGGRPFQVYKSNRKEPYQFGRDSASLYDNIMFIYEFNNGDTYLICHRQGHSGCKTVFQRISNKI